MSTLTHRPYRSFADLFAIGRLVRRMQGRDFSSTGWAFTRHDIWCQRRMAEALAWGRHEWQRHIEVWEDAQGEVQAALLLPDQRGKNPGLTVLLADPDAPQLYERLLAQAQNHCARHLIPQQALAVECTDANRPLVELLQAHGFSRSPDWMNLLYRSLPAEALAVQLPAGYRLKTIDTPDEQQAYMESVQAVFGFLDTPEGYRALEAAPSFRHELGLIVLPEDSSQVAAFGRAWYDPHTGLAEFEPVGTRSEQQQRGLGLALMAEGCNRLRALGCRLATVQSWSEAPGANRLYARAGFVAQSRHYEWTRQ